MLHRGFFFQLFCLFPNIGHCYFTFNQVNVNPEHEYFINTCTESRFLRKSQGRHNKEIV